VSAHPGRQVAVTSYRADNLLINHYISIMSLLENGLSVRRMVIVMVRSWVKSTPIATHAERLAPRVRSRQEGREGVGRVVGEIRSGERANMLTRRRLIAVGLVGAAAAFSSACRTVTADPLATFEVTASPAVTFEVTHSDAEWRKLLTPEQYAVLRQEATEQPFTSALLNEERTGTFGCAGCDLALFSSTTKFDSQTGWPSFSSPLENAVGTTSDTSLGMVRMAVHCRRCGGHLGHLFDDGPKPTGLRYCMNGVALTFNPATT
jgi:peptide-methionine (R)-S-oxide reductase